MCTIEQVTVYTDVQDAELLGHITAAALNLCKDSTICGVTDKDAADPLAFLNLWEKERDDVWAFVNNSVPLLHRFECFITDSKDEKSGAVAYALHYRKMPVLSLVAPVTDEPSAIVDGTKNNVNGNHNGNNDENEDDWITAALYFTTAKLGCVSLFEAVKTFFSFPKTGGGIVAIEGEDTALVMSQCRLLCAHMRSGSKLPVYIVGGSGCDLAEGGTETVECEKEHSLYATLIEDFLKSSICELQEIREEDPQLHGALCALNRYHNLPLLRYRLQSGASVIFYRPFSIVLEELVERCSRKGMNVAQTQEFLSTIVSSLLHFEAHWLGMPSAEVILICAKKNGDTPLTTPSLEHWSTLLWGEGDTPIVGALSKWHKVVVNSASEKETSAITSAEGVDSMQVQDEIQNSIVSVLQPLITV